MVWILEITSRAYPSRISSSVRFVSSTTVTPRSSRAVNPGFCIGLVSTSSFPRVTRVPSISKETSSPRAKASTTSLPSMVARCWPIFPSSLPYFGPSVRICGFSL